MSASETPSFVTSIVKAARQAAGRDRVAVERLRRPTAARPRRCRPCRCPSRAVLVGRTRSPCCSRSTRCWSSCDVVVTVIDSVAPAREVRQRARDRRWLARPHSCSAPASIESTISRESTVSVRMHVVGIREAAVVHVDRERLADAARSHRVRVERLRDREMHVLGRRSCASCCSCRWSGSDRSCRSKPPSRVFAMSVPLSTVESSVTCTVNAWFAVGREAGACSCR